MKREVKIGIFAVVIICCSWAGIRFLSGIDIFGRNMVYYASYDKINGINTASPILVQGVKVGKVSEIILDPLKSDKVTLRFSIDRKYKLPTTTVASIYSPGIMSSMAIGLDMGDGREFLKSGDYINTNEETNLMDVASEKLMSISEQIEVVGKELTQTLKSVNSILDCSGEDINSTLDNLNKLSGELSGVMKSQSKNLESAVAGLSTFSSTLGDNADKVESIIANLNTLSSQFSEADLASNLTTTIDELNAALSKLNSAEGSAGKLLSDEELYENLTAVSGSLNELLIDMQENPKRYVHFSLFGAKDKKSQE
ncbi:MAG: MlaD family protein [Rikenellaceae bacterium]